MAKGLRLERTNSPEVRVPKAGCSTENAMLNSISARPYVKECEYDYRTHMYTVVMEDGQKYQSADGEAWYKPGSAARETKAPWESAVELKLVISPDFYDTPTQKKIKEVMGSMSDLLIYKNRKYGDSAINPKNVFYKGDSTNSILIRLDDKLGRVMANTDDKPRVNDVCDIIGYCTLLLISMGVTEDDIAKLKD